MVFTRSSQSEYRRMPKRAAPEAAAGPCGAGGMPRVAAADQRRCRELGASDGVRATAGGSGVAIVGCSLRKASGQHWLAAHSSPLQPPRRRTRQPSLRPGIGVVTSSSYVLDCLCEFRCTQHMLRPLTEKKAFSVF